MKLEIIQKIRSNHNNLLLYLFFFVLPVTAQEAVSIKIKTLSVAIDIQIGNIKQQINNLRDELILIATQTELDELLGTVKLLIETINGLDDSIIKKKKLVKRVTEIVEDCEFLHAWMNSSIENQIIFIMELDSLAKAPIEMLACMKFARITKENIKRDKNLSPVQRKKMEAKLDYIITGGFSESKSNFRGVSVNSDLGCIAQ